MDINKSKRDAFNVKAERVYKDLEKLFREMDMMEDSFRKEILTDSDPMTQIIKSCTSMQRYLE